MNGVLWGWLALGVVFGTGFVWFRKIHAVQIPENRSGYFLAMGLGVALGLAALWQGSGLAAGIAAWVAVLAGGFFLVLRLQSSQQAHRPAVVAGEAIIDFTAPDEHGHPFSLSSLRGKPFLLKFFRGHW